MFLITAVLLALLFVAIIIFAFPKFSRIPYFPSNPKDISLILKELELKDKQVIIDLGAGDGIVIFNAATESLNKKLNTEFIAIETNPILVVIMHVRNFFHPNRKRIHIIMKDLFTANYKNILYSTLPKSAVDYKLTFYLYISHWLIKNAVTQVQKSVKTFRTVSYFYPVPFFKETKRNQGRNNIYIYNSPSA